MQKKLTKTLNINKNKLSSLLNDDFNRISKLKIPWKRFKNKKFLITGGGGFIVSYLIKILFLINEQKKLNISIDCTTRSKKKN